MAGTLFVVATPIGNLDDVSARAIRVLQNVARIAAEDTRRTAHLLARYGITTPTTSLHEHNEHRKSAELVARLNAGEDIALVSDAGSPAISDPGRHLVSTAAEAGIRVEVIPGPSAVIAALAASGFDASAFTFLGFPPTRVTDREAWLRALKTAGRTVVFFEAPHRLSSTLHDILRVAGDHRVLIGRELTKAHEQCYRGRLSAVIEEIGIPRGEFTIAVELGDMTETNEGLATLPNDQELVAAVDAARADGHMTKRAAANSVARKFGLTTNDVYRALESAKSKQSVE